MTVRTFALVGDGSALGNQDRGKQYVVKRTVDCSKDNVGAADVVKLMPVPANTLVKEVIANVRTAEGGTLTFDVGDYLTADDSAVDADGYLDGTNGNSAAASKTSDTDTLGHYAGKFYANALAYIGVLFNNAADAAVIDFMIVCVDCR